MKEHGRHYLDNHNYKDIHMPNNTHTGVIMGIFMLLGGFFLIFETVIPRNLLSRYSWFISLPKFRTRSWLSYPCF